MALYLQDVSDTLKPPAAIRIARPYANEDEFLAQELDMLTRTTVTLVGAASRPQGVVLRFEILLASGQVVLRGEGRVLAFKPNAHRGVGGLTLRFTRLDTRSKALVDRAAALRDRRRPSQAPLPSAASLPELPPSGPSLDSPTKDPPSGPVPDVRLAAVPPSARPPPVQVTLDARSASAARDDASPELLAEPGSAVRLAGARVVQPAPDREALLTRLRARAKALDAGDVQRILAQTRQAKG